MVWEAEPIKRFFEIKCIGGSRSYTDSQEYTCDEYGFTKLSLNLAPEYQEVRVKCFDLEHLRYAMDGSSDGVNELFVGIRDGTKINYIGTFWTSSAERRVEQYFFKDNQPSGFNFGMMSGPTWPLNRPAWNGRVGLLEYFNSLKERSEKSFLALSIISRLFL